MTLQKGSRKGLLQNMTEKDVQGLKEIYQQLLDMKHDVEHNGYLKVESNSTATAGWLSGATSYFSPSSKEVKKSASFETFTYEQFEQELMREIKVDHPDNLMIRYLRARKHNSKAAFEMIYDSIKFFHDWGMEEILLHGERELVQYPLECGEEYYHGRDREGNTILYQNARLHNPKECPLERYSKNMLYIMSQGYFMLGDKRILNIIDLQGMSLSNVNYSILKFMASILANNFPELLSRILIINAPWIFSGVWNVVCTFLDPVVKDKIQFLSQDDLTKYIDKDQLPVRLGGTNKFEYSYTTPTKEQTSVKHDPAELKRLQKERKTLGYTFFDKTQEWLDGKPVEEERDRLADDLARNFRELAPYIISPSIYHRNGFIKNFDDVDFS